MTMTENLVRAALAFLDEAEVLAADFGPEVDAAIEKIATVEFDNPEVLKELHDRVLDVLRNSEAVDTSVANRLERLLLESRARKRPAHGTIELQSRNGLAVRPVMPAPEFLGRTIPLVEGYVDILQLPLWENNARVQLLVAAFEDRYGRMPAQEELLGLMTGAQKVPGQSADDPYDLKPLAASIAKRGVELPPVLDYDGVPRDGNRRIAACKLLLNSNAPAEIKERARYVRVWLSDTPLTDNQVHAIVVARNFEPELKLEWAEYVKARLVAKEFEHRRLMEPELTASRESALRKEVGEHFSIPTNRVTRYLKMVQWANDFKRYHVEERERDEHEVEYKANENFQWFYEIEAGKSGEKLTDQLALDDELRAAVYDLMYDVLDSGRLLRGLHKVIAEDGGADQLVEASQDDPKEALEAVKRLVAESEMTSKKRLGLERHLKTLSNSIDKLGATAPDQWQTFPTEFLKDLKRTFSTALSTIEAELERRGETRPK